MSHLDGLGIELRVEGGRLRCRAAKGTLTPELRSDIEQRRPEIVAFLERARPRDGSDLQPLPRVRRDGELPLSYAQQRLWFLDQLWPGSHLYNTAANLRLTGPVDLVALEQSFNEIVRRHESLRTRFAAMDGRPHQIVIPEMAVPLAVTDLRSVPAEKRSDELRRLAGEELRRGFDLSKGSLLRTTLIRAEDQEYALLVTAHHIVTDGWSMGILNHELSVLYEAFLRGEPSPLEEPSLQYADFAAWQRDWLAGNELDAHLAYWKKQLDGLAVLQLPTDRPRPAVPAHRGATVYMELPTTLLRSLDGLGRDTGVTLFMVLLTAFEILLHGYTGQCDVALGSPIANRDREDIESIVGFFVNMLVLRTDLSGDPTFLEALERVRQVAIDAYAHQALPFEKLVEELEPERSLSRNPLVQVSFGFQKAPASPARFPEVEVRPLMFGVATSRFDLEVNLWEEQERLRGAFIHSTELFDPATVEGIVSNFAALLEGIAGDPRRRISELPLLADDERNRVLVDWNDTQSDYPDETCVQRLFEARVARTPDSLAIACEDEQVSYTQLNVRANRLANHLASLGVGPESLVGICVERSVEMIVGLLGILKAGGAYVPLDPRHPRERLAFVLEDSRIRVLLTQQRWTSSLPDDDVSTVCLDTDWETIATQSSRNPTPEVRAENLAYVTYTSGSTGTPKGVAVTHRNLVSSTHARTVCYGESRNRFLLLSSVAVDSSVAGIFWTLCSGGTLLISHEDLLLDPPELAEEVARKRVSHVLFLPSAYIPVLERAKDRQLSGLDAVIVAAEPCPETLPALHAERAPRAALFNEYGPTEATVWSTAHRFPSAVKGGKVSIGRPIANAEIYLVDSHLNAVPVRAPGEVCIAGPGIARGYHARADLTAERFLPDPFGRRPGDRLYRTGDLARYAHDGNIEFLGRTDRQVKIRGFRVEPGEVEAVLRKHPGVREAVVTTLSDRRGETRLTAYVVRTKSHSTLSMRRFAREKLPESMVPSQWVFLEALPRLPNGKVDWEELQQAQATRLEPEEAHVAPRTSTEKVLATLWAEVLSCELVGVHDTFFDLGGHSLQVIVVVDRLEKKLGVRVPPRDFFVQTLTQIATGIEARLKKMSAPVR